MHATPLAWAHVTRGFVMSPREGQWARALHLVVLLVMWLTFTDAWPLQPVPPHKGITRRTYIRHYEPAWYDTNALQQHQDRVRRDAPGSIRDQPLILRIHVLDRHWTMRLTRDSDLFAKDAVFEGTNGPIKFDSTYSYSGTIQDDENAVVQGLVTDDGLFDGTIVTGFEEYYIEPTNRYLSGDDDTSPPYHTIAYRASDVMTPSHPLPCASHDLHQGILSESLDRTLNVTNKASQPYYEHLLDNEIQFNGGYYSKEEKLKIVKPNEHYDLQFLNSLDRERFVRHLNKRATVDPRKTTCMLYLQADHQFFARYGTEEACIEVMTRHVQRVNSIYKYTDI